jgi:hypothetical protein
MAWSGEGELLIVDVASRQTTSVRDVDEPFWAAWHPDGRTLAVVSGPKRKGSNGVEIYVGRPGAMVKAADVGVFAPATMLFDVDFHPSGEELMVTSDAGLFFLRLKDRNVYRVVFPKKHTGSRFLRHTWSRDGRFLGGQIFASGRWWMIVIDFASKRVAVYDRSYGRDDKHYLVFIDREEAIANVKAAFPNYRTCCVVNDKFVRIHTWLYKECRHCRLKLIESHYPGAEATTEEAKMVSWRARYHVEPHTGAGALVPPHPTFTVDVSAELERKGEETWDVSRATATFDDGTVIDLAERFRAWFDKPPISRARYEADDPDLLETMYRAARKPK